MVSIDEMISRVTAIDLVRTYAEIRMELEKQLKYCMGEIVKEEVEGEEGAGEIKP